MPLHGSLPCRGERACVILSEAMSMLCNATQDRQAIVVSSDQNVILLRREWQIHSSTLAMRTPHIKRQKDMTTKDEPPWGKSRGQLLIAPEGDEATGPEQK